MQMARRFLSGDWTDRAFAMISSEFAGEKVITEKRAYDSYSSSVSIDL